MARTLATCVPTWARATLIVALAASISPALSHQVPLTAFQDLSDGRAEDLAGPSTVLDPVNERVWIANGRVRWAIRIEDRQHQLSEDWKFSSGSQSFSGIQRVLAVELDEFHHRLITLTEAIVAVQDVSIPSAPSDPSSFDLLTDNVSFTKLQSGEDVLDVKLWADAANLETRIFVLTSKRIISLSYLAGSFPAIQYKGQTSELFASGAPQFEFPPSGDPFFDDLHVRLLNKLRIGLDANGKVMAYVLAEAFAFESAGRPKPRIVMACDLNAPTFDAPTFDAVPGAGIKYVFFNPIPQGATGQDAIDNAASDLALASPGFERYLYVACGKQ